MSEKQTSIEYLKGVGPERARLLKEELKITTIDDLLHFFPNRYIDRSQFHLINELPKNNDVSEKNLEDNSSLDAKTETTVEAN